MGVSDIINEDQSNSIDSNGIKQHLNIHVVDADSASMVISKLPQIELVHKEEGVRPLP